MYNNDPSCKILTGDPNIMGSFHLGGSSFIIIIIFMEGLAGTVTTSLCVKQSSSRVSLLVFNREHLSSILLSLCVTTRN